MGPARLRKCSVLSRPLFRPLFRPLSRPVVYVSTLVLAAACAGWLALTTEAPALPTAPVAPPAGSENTFFGPIRAAETPEQTTSPAHAATPRPEAASRPVAATVPSWLWGVPEQDRHPKAVYDAWRAWAATQGHTETAARELIAYAKAHPMRRSHGEEKSVDEWMDVLGTTDDAVLVQAALAQGYLAPLLAARDDGREDAWRDLRAFMGCKLEICGQLRAVHSLSDGLGRAALAWASDAASRCGIAVTAAPVTRGLALEVDAQLAQRGYRETSGMPVSPQFLAGGAGSMPCEVMAARIATGG